MLYIAYCVCRGIYDCTRILGETPVHGDIKPENIFLEPVDPENAPAAVLGCRVLLMDCGCNGSTEGYMPEGEDRQTAQTDVYALALVLTELMHCAAEDSAGGMRSMIEILLKKEGWRDYTLDRLYPELEAVVQKRFRMENGTQPSAAETRSQEIWNQAKKIMTGLEYLHTARENFRPETLEQLRDEAYRSGYTIRTEGEELPLYVVLDQIMYFCFLFTGYYREAAERFALFREEFTACSDQGSARYRVEEYLEPFRGMMEYALGNREAAAGVFQAIALENCRNLNWLDFYIQICSEKIWSDDSAETEQLQNKLAVYRDALAVSGAAVRDPVRWNDILLYYGMTVRMLGNTAEAVSVHEECFRAYPDNQKYLYEYGLSLTADGQLSRAKYPFSILYDRCREISGYIYNTDTGVRRPVTVLRYFAVSAFYLGKFPEAAEACGAYTEMSGEEFADSRYVLGREMFERAKKMYESIAALGDRVDPLHPDREALTVLMGKYSDLIGLAAKKQEEPRGNMLYIMERGVLEALLHLHERVCLCLLTMEEYDRIVKYSGMMLRIFRDSSLVQFYLAVALAKTDPRMAVMYFVRSAEMLRYEYPDPADPAADSEMCGRRKKLIRDIMTELGLDAALIL